MPLPASRPLLAALLAAPLLLVAAPAMAGATATATIGPPSCIFEDGSVPVRLAIAPEAAGPVDLELWADSQDSQKPTLQPGESAVLDVADLTDGMHTIHVTAGGESVLDQNVQITCDSAPTGAYTNPRGAVSPGCGDPGVELYASNQPVGDNTADLKPVHFVVTATGNSGVLPLADFTLPDASDSPYDRSQTFAAGSDFPDEVTTFVVTANGDVVSQTEYDPGCVVIVDPPPVPCIIKVPAEVRVISPSKAVYGKFHNCSGWTLSWAIRHRIGTKDVRFGSLGVKDGVSIGPWRYRDSWPTGTYSVRPPAIGGPNTTQLTVKFGSRVTMIAGPRAIGHFKLSGDVSRYVASVNGFRGWANRTVAISYKNCASGCPWRFLTTDRTDSAGHFGLTISSSQVRYYRGTVASTSSVWGFKSTAVKR